VNSASGSKPDADAAAEQIDLPLLIGMRFDVAAEILWNLGLQPVVPGKRGSPAPEDPIRHVERSQIVTSQRPAPPVRVAAGSQIELGLRAD